MTNSGQNLVVTHRIEMVVLVVVIPERRGRRAAEPALDTPDTPRGAKSPA